MKQTEGFNSEVKYHLSPLNVFYSETLETSTLSEASWYISSGMIMTSRHLWRQDIPNCHFVYFLTHPTHPWFRIPSLTNLEYIWFFG